MSKVHSLSLVDRVRYAYLAYFSKPKVNRAVYRAIRKLRPKAIVEIGVGSAERAVRAISLAAKLQPGERIAFTAVDMFEASPPGRASLGVKKCHQHLSATGAKIQLVPGDPFSALARMANSLMGTDLLIIAADQQGESLDRAWFYVPRMLHDASVVLLEEPAADGMTAFRQLAKSEVVGKYVGDMRRRAA
ncbi:MAG: hypothetical protein DCC68_24790 [Planctomycetota bacterium]|nr:MAG: hypothetical protein DCC68_24790 [Planctomycetota bacterium]